ncbi:hypothetical protein B0A48_05637 [Cryoendolithus antarcticus]|uniref:Uncharacterized protein n=1 Tax=Cryoendolithus antarcticus TaxID=1507870 RepID=A0A1V8TJF9_9PEZI|nr:hypothetical protein B0A48_05637 [Cryoendolithus antarcticus]
MCLITTPNKSKNSRQDSNIRRGDRYDAPRPVSNYTGGPQVPVSTYRRSSRTYDRASVPLERRSRSSYRASGDRLSRVEVYEPRRSREVDMVRTSRTYVR